MHGFRPKGIPGRQIRDDLWKHTLAQIPTLYGRLAYLAGLRDPSSGVYRHHGLRLMFGRKQSEIALRDSHLETFQQWVSSTLADKKLDLDHYLAGLKEPRRTVVDTWLKSSVYRDLAPHTVPRIERRLFIVDLEALLRAIRNEPGDDVPD